MLSVTLVYMEQHLRSMYAVGDPVGICLCIREGLDRAVERRPPLSDIGQDVGSISLQVLAHERQIQYCL